MCQAEKRLCFQMDTTKVQDAFPSVVFTEARNAANKPRLLAEHDSIRIEICPDASVSILTDAVTEDVYKIINLYMEPDTAALLARAADFRASKPDTNYSEQINGLMFSMGTGKAGGGQGIALQILDLKAAQPSP
jgi:hypothetical protein